MDTAKKTIALISPRRSLWSKNSRIKAVFERNKEFLKTWYSPSLSLLTIAAVTPARYGIELIDEEFETIDFQRKYDIVGISAMTQQASRAYEIADRYRSLGVTVAMGGIHATVLPEEALKHVDSVVVGEGEGLWKKFLHDWENGSILRRYENPPGFSTCLEDSPVPRYDLVKKDHFSENKGYFHMIPIQATRGCPHDCCFCIVSRIYGKKIRKKNNTQIINELKRIRELFCNQLILFTDDNLFVDKSYTKILMKEMEPLKVHWVGQSDISVADDDELLRSAYQSGCMMLLIGFESLNQKSLEGINTNHWKMNQSKKYKEAVKKIQEHGIIVHAAFVVGFDEDDQSVFTKIRDFSIANHCTGQYTILTPIPGSRQYEELRKEKRLLKEVFWDECNFFNVVFRPKMMTAEQIENGLVRLYNKLFSQSEFLKRAKYMKAIYKKMLLRQT
jgi:radical SAM superfamily enzyme YgiQ (UPF0313 family)